MIPPVMEIGLGLVLLAFPVPRNSHPGVFIAGLLGVGLIIGDGIWRLLTHG